MLSLSSIDVLSIIVLKRYSFKLKSGLRILIKLVISLKIEQCFKCEKMAESSPLPLECSESLVIRFLSVLLPTYLLEQPGQEKY